MQKSLIQNTDILELQMLTHLPFPSQENKTFLWQVTELLTSFQVSKVASAQLASSKLFFGQWLQHPNLHWNRS